MPSGVSVAVTLETQSPLPPHDRFSVTLLQLQKSLLMFRHLSEPNLSECDQFWVILRKQKPLVGLSEMTPQRNAISTWPR
jgi:hypothetical protein